MQFFEMFKLLLSIFPLIIDNVKTIETAFPALKGNDKLALVMNTVTTASEHANDMQASLEVVIPAVEKLVNNVVSTYNTLGIFQHDEAPIKPVRKG